MKETISEIKASPVPEGIDQRLWEKLTAELIRVIETLELEEGIGRKQASDAPTDDGSSTTLNWDEEVSTLTWGYYCTGDYDQNGEVNIADLTPLGLNFGWSSGGGAVGEDTIESVVDGDSNGEINIADVTPIGQNFQRRVTGYNIYQSLSTDDVPASNGDPSSLEPADSVAMSAAIGNPAQERLWFSFKPDPLVPNAFYWVRPSDGGKEGTPGIPFDTRALNARPTANLTASPLSGPAVMEVDFDASGSTDDDGTVEHYEFDFGEGSGWVDLGAEATATHTYTAEGTYQAQVRVTDDDGATATANVEINIQPGYADLSAGLNALIAVPDRNEAEIDEPVMIRVVSGPSHPLRTVRGVRMTVPGEAEYIANSIDLGSPDGNPDPDRPMQDGIWEDVGPTEYLIPSDNIVGFTGIGGGTYAFDYGVWPMAGGSSSTSGGELFNFQISFPQAGIYRLGFVQFDGVNRTWYAYSVDDYFWDDLSNVDPSFNNTIYVGYPMYAPGPDTLFAVPSDNEIAVGEEVLIRVITGVPADPFKFMNGVRMVFNGPVEYVANSFDIGNPDSHGAPDLPLDGIWVDVGSSTFIQPPDFLFDATDLGGGQWVIDANVTPLAGSQISGIGGELYNLRVTFPTPGTYDITFMESYGGSDRTHYSDDAAGDYYWDNITNESSQFSNTIVVTP